MKNILVPVDFSEPSKVAARYAVKLAGVLHAKIHLLLVQDSVPETLAFKNTQQWSEVIIKNGLDLGKALIEEIKSQAPAHVEILFACKSGWPIFSVIEHYTTDHHIDLIVMGSKGASGIKKVILGSNAAAVINHSSVPVIVVPGNTVYHGIKSMVYATDMKHMDLQIDQVNDFAKAFSADLHIIHVQPEGTTEVEAEVEVIEFNNITTLTQTVPYFYTSKSVAVAKAIEGYVRNQNGDLLVLLTQKLDFFEKLLGSSVTRILASQNQIPILTFIKRNGE